jgi:GxxExxY protein
MDFNSCENLHKEITEKIISAFYKVYNTLGFGFLEKVYEKALKIELESFSLDVKNQYPIKVFYNGYEVGDYFADLMVNDKVIIELKAVDALIKEHECQLINYLKATEFEVGLLLNFGKQPEIKRRVFTNNLKKLKHS